MAKQTLLSGAALIALIASPSHAQNVEGPAVTAAQSSESNVAAAASQQPAVGTQPTNQGGIQDIVVTARRRQESAQTVPVAVSVATAETLEQHQVLNTYQLVNLTPSLQVQSANQQAGAVNFTIRGVGTTPIGPQTESSVGVVIDDVAMGRPQFGNVQFFDLERVEVLRGPQGMLFGKNAAAGLINIVTAQPKLGRTEFLANVQYGNTTAPGSGNVASLQVAGNTPIGADAALRVSLFVNRQDAYVRNIVLNENLGNTAYGGRVKFLWAPADGIRLTFAGDLQHSVGPGEGVLVHRFTAPGGLLTTINAANSVFASRKNVLLAADIPNEVDSDVYGGQIKAEVELGGGFTLTNVLARRVFNQSNSIDTDTVNADLFNLNTGGFRYRQTTEELRLSSPSSGPFSFQIGVFYLDLKAFAFLLQGGNLGNPVPPGLSLVGGFLDQTAFTKSYAGFFEGQAKITDALRVTAGARYTHDRISLRDKLSNPSALIAIYPSLDIVPRTTENNISYRFGLDYTLAPDILIYGTYSRGYKGPTFDQLTGNLVAPEIPTSYEVGLKSTLLDRRLRLNVALFDTTFDGFQTQAQAPGLSAGFLTLNAGQLKTRGVEVEFTALPIDGLTISGGVTYNDTEYQDLTAIPCYYNQPTGTSGTNVCKPNLTTDVSGNQLANAPRWSTTSTVRYEQPVLQDWVGFLQGDVYYRTAYYFSQTRDPNTRVGANAIVGLSAGASTSDGRFSVTAFVRNLFDKRVPSYILADPVATVYTGPTGMTDAALGGNYWQNFGPNSFRTVGVALSYKM